MENQPVSPKKVMLNYGLYLGLASIVLSVILYVLNMHLEQSLFQTIGGLLIIGAIVVLGISEFKKRNGNVLSLGQALKIGLGIAAVGALIGIVYTFIFMYFIEPDFMNQMGEIQREAMLEKNPNMTQAQIDNAEKMMKTFSSPWMIAIFQMISTLFIAFIVALIGGLVMKNDR